MEGVSVRSIFSFTLLIAIPSLLYTNPTPLPEMCNSPEQIANYYIPGLSAEGSYLTRHLAGYGVMKLMFYL